ncbi:IS5 family transposase [Pontibacter fetidus]|uniref:IS5 family transposase n=1 Tax=Pontibacter fetidus TaxID=2700082 RepID=UPI00192ECE33|nr:IS5 family transposase [Pontibacter fetidus]
MKLTDKQWGKLKDLIPDGARRADGKGRPWRDKREVLEGILWILKTGAQWSHLPAIYPPYQTCHRRFQQWQKQGVMQLVVEALAKDLQERGEVDLSECFIDGSFCMAKKGGLLLGKTKRGKGTKIMAVTDAGGTILSVSIQSASPHEVKLVENVLEERFIEDLPTRLIGDRAYDSDPLDEELKQQGIEMIAPHRKNRKKKKTQDERKLRRFKRRWKVERFFAWLFNYRKCVVRYEYKEENFKAFILLACMLILLKPFMR